MRKTLVVLTVVTVVVAAGSRSMRSEEILRELVWEKPVDGSAKLDYAWLAADKDAPFARIQLENAKDAPLSVTVLTVVRPGITSPLYALRGRVRTEGIEGPGYLEMWSHFPDGGQFFSRTLGTGAMAPLEGTASWRGFVLPFQNKPDGPAPEKLVLNVVLKGKGRVLLGPLQLVQFPPGTDLLAAPGQWFSERTAGIVGGCLGGFVGILGAITGVLASRCRARGFVLGLLKLEMLLGVACLTLGAMAVYRAQPYAVYYPLLLIGVLCIGIPGGLHRHVAARYREGELRKMQALDIP